MLFIFGEFAWQNTHQFLYLNLIIKHVHFGSVCLAYFSNRIEAGRRLAESLEEFAGDGGVVLAIPRGGVVLGYEIA